jgi:hypothetical protein
VGISDTPAPVNRKTAWNGISDTFLTAARGDNPFGFQLKSSLKRKRGAEYAQQFFSKTAQKQKKPKPGFLVGGDGLEPPTLSV